MDAFVIDGFPGRPAVGRVAATAVNFTRVERIAPAIATHPDAGKEVKGCWLA